MQSTLTSQCPRRSYQDDSSGGTKADPGVSSVTEAAEDLPVPFALVTRLFDELIPVLLETPEGESDLPGSRIHVRVLNRDFVMDRIRVDEREAFDHVHGVCVEIRRLVEPRLGVLIGHIDNRIALPAATRVPCQRWMVSPICERPSVGTMR